MLPDKVTASIFHRFMRSGRTSPMLCTCVGHGDIDTDIIVKLNGAMDFGTRSAVFELVGAQLAAKLGIESPESYLVWLSPEFVDAMVQYDPSKENIFRKSIGWNFGSQMLKDATIWSSSARVSTSMIPDALKIFSFDGLIQNVDRRRDNPNLLIQKDRLCVIDHECGFSFLSSIIPSNEPWTLGAGDYMDRHALRQSLKGNNLDWATNRNVFLELTDGFFDELAEIMPVEWAALADLITIKEHVAKVLERIEDFEIELQRRIA